MVFHSVKKNKIKGVLFKIDFEKVLDKVNSDFLFEILEGRNFSVKWIRWIKDSLKGSKTCTNFNDTLGEYFNYKR